MFLLFSWHKAQLTEQEYDIAVTYAVEAVRIQPRQPASKIPYMLHTHTHTIASRQHTEVRQKRDYQRIKTQSIKNVNYGIILNTVL